MTQVFDRAGRAKACRYRKGLGGWFAFVFPYYFPGIRKQFRINPVLDKKEKAGCQGEKYGFNADAEKIV